MKLKTLTGKSIYKNCAAYRVDWNKKSRSKIQKTIKEYCEIIWKNNVVFEEFPVFGTRYTLDLYNASKNIAIEIQGVQHTKYLGPSDDGKKKGFFHKGREDFLHQLKKDGKKAEFCEINDIILVEIFESEMKSIKTIEDFLEIYNKAIGKTGE